MKQLQYFILIWIIILIIFTLYCIYKLFKKNKTSSFNNVTNIVQHINDIQQYDTITKLKGCENIYDDNIAVRTLGYNNCSSAYADYFNKNLNINNKYGNTKTLAQICPVSTKSAKYFNCIQQLLNKFNTNSIIIDNINTNMTDILNTRINERSNILNSIESDINPYLSKKEQLEFKNNVENIYAAQNIGDIANDYYQSKSMKIN